MKSTLQRTDRSFQDIYETYLPTVYRVAYSFLKNPYDSEDAAHETFLRLLRQKKPPQSEEHLKGWLIVTASNVCRDMLRRRRNTELSLEEAPQAETRPPEANALMEAIMALPERYKTAVYLYYYEGYSVREMAALLDKPENTLKSWLKRAREQLRQELGDDFYEG